MKRIALALAFGAALMFPARAASGDTTPAQVTAHAYDAALNHFGFSHDWVKAEKPFLTPRLYAAILRKARQPVPPGDAPDIEGDLLLDAQELPTSPLRYGAATVTGDHAQVPVTLTWDSEQRHYTVQLTRLDGAWKIDNVAYGKGKLTDQLK